MTKLTKLELTAQTPQEATLASAKAFLDDLSQQATASARRRGESANQTQLLMAELRAISPAVGPDGLVVDPADGDPTLRSRRVAKRHKLEEVRCKTAAEDDARRELEPRLAEARLAVRLADVECRKVRLRQAAIYAVDSVSDANNKVWNLYVETEALAAEFPSHEFPKPGVTIPAHLGAPALSRSRINQFLDLARKILATLAEWDPSAFGKDAPERIRAMHIRAVEQHAALAGLEVQRRRSEASK